MLWPSEEVLDRVDALIPPELVGETERERCRHVARQLPPVAASYYLECRLHESARVDYLVLFKNRVTTGPAFRKSIAHPERSRTWTRNLGLLEAWAEDAPNALADVQLMWLEYDIEAGFRPEQPEASPSVCLERGYFGRHQGPPVVDAEAALRRGRAGLALLADPEHGAALGAMLERCVRALPERGSAVYLSQMTARERVVTKLYVSLPKTNVVDYLRWLSFPGDLQRVQRVLDHELALVRDTAFLDLSIVGERLEPRLGFAFSQFHAREMQRFDPAWRTLPMAGVVKQKRNSLAAWPGQHEVAIGGLRTNVRRWVDVKLVLSEASEVEFKAYLGFAPQLPVAFA